jgi:rhodanese-related sulfurtransferase
MKIQMKVLGVSLISLFAAVAVAGCLAVQPNDDVSDTGNDLPSYGVITTQQAASVIVALQDDPRFVLLDIRTPAEVEAGHLSGTVELDFYSESFRDDLAALDRDLIYLIYCRTGNRTGQTYKIMGELGFERVYDMGGGISQWLAADYPVCLGSLNAEHSCVGEYPTI